MGLEIYIVTYRPAKVKFPKNPISHIKTALELCETLKFLSLLPLRVYDNQNLATDVVMGNIPEV